VGAGLKRVKKGVPPSKKGGHLWAPFGGGGVKIGEIIGPPPGGGKAVLAHTPWLRRGVW